MRDWGRGDWVQYKSGAKGGRVFPRRLKNERRGTFINVIFTGSFIA